MNKKTEKSARSKAIEKSGYIFILTNFVLGIINIIAGLLSGSIVITSDATHSFIDAVSGLIIVIGEKLSNHQKLSNHRPTIERIVTIIISIIIIVTGVHIIIESIEKIIEPENIEYSAVIIFILLISIILKYALAFYLNRNGKKLDSKVLLASSTETLADTAISVAVLISLIIYQITKFNIEAYVSILIAIIIIKAGLEFIFPKISHHHHHHLESDTNHTHI